MTTANEISFGIELETTLPTADTTPIGNYHAGLPVAWLPGWKAEKDSSIRPQAPNRKGCEFVSPILRGIEGIENVKNACEQIKARGGKVNHTCGLHITITWNGDAAATARLLSLVANHEKGIFAATGTTRRETAIYCKKIKGYQNATTAKRRCDSDRYHMINLTHLARGRNRVEIRAFAGSLNPQKIAGYIMMVLGLAELALNNTRCSEWSFEKREGAARSCWDIKDAGEGQNELNRLFYRLGWTKGWYKGRFKSTTFGYVTNAEGQGPELKGIKKALLSLAAKYDGGC